MGSLTFPVMRSAEAWDGADALGTPAGGRRPAPGSGGGIGMSGGFQDDSLANYRALEPREMAGFPKRQQAGDNQSRSEKKSLI